MHWVFACGLIGMLFYCGSDWQPQGSFIEWAHKLPDNPAGRSMVWLSEHLCIFTNAGEGIVKQVRHNCRGHGAYLLGRSDDRALWWYFPALLSIKLSLPLLLAPLAVLLVRPRALLNWALLAAGFVILISPVFRVQIGIRLVLPIVALAVVGLAGALVEACRGSQRHWQRYGLASVGVFGVIWAAITAATVWPNGLCYVNPLWGGTQEGYRLVSDGNYDWGQGLKELARWQRGRDLPTMDVWYFGCDPLASQLPIRVVPFHDLAIHGTDEMRALVHGHFLAVSTTVLFGMDRAASPESHRLAAAFLRGQKPVARTTTFFIYDFTRP